MTTRRAFAAFLWPLPGLEAAPQLGKILESISRAGLPALGNDRIVAGLRQALSIGAANAIALTGRPDGFFANQAIRILLPDRLRRIEKALRAAGMGRKLDEFELSLNRAAEAAAPAAQSIFLDAIRAITLDDARGILTGGGTAATDYFKIQTAPGLIVAFQPIIEKMTDDFGVTRQYKQLTRNFLSFLPFAKKDGFDLDRYVVTKTLDGIFYMLGREESKIRTDPSARVTTLLREVFGF